MKIKHSLYLSFLLNILLILNGFFCILISYLVGNNFNLNKYLASFVAMIPEILLYFNLVLLTWGMVLLAYEAVTSFFKRSRQKVVGEIYSRLIVDTKE